MNGLNTYYEIHGEGESLILLHGGFGATGMFAELLSVLASHRRLGRPARGALAGFGRIEQAGTVRCRYCMPDEDDLPAYVNRNPKPPFCKV